MNKTVRTFSADFETTSYKGQTYTEVWASAIVELNTENVHIFNSIDKLWDYMKSLKCNIIVYFHNLKFDGSFWLPFLMQKLYMQPAYIQRSQRWLSNKEMPNHSFKYVISDKGQWYSITIKENNKIIEIRDSLKLLPFSVKQLGDSFRTMHKKSSIEYTGYRKAGGLITEKEKEYIANDVLVVKEALEITLSQGHTKLTIGSCCLSEFKELMKTNSAYDWDTLFPNLYKEDAPIWTNESSAGEFVKRSYRGGWCYVNKYWQGKVVGNGVTLDVNSLYPSMMHSISGNWYPVGKPRWFTGDINFNPDYYYFIRIKTRFYLKIDHLPFLQMKYSFYYKKNECLESSDIEINGQKVAFYKDETGYHSTAVELTLTQTDYILLQEHYDLIDLEVIGGCYFNTMVGIFDDYINKYMGLKMNATGAVRTLAKLYLNNLCGKLAMYMNSSYKIAYIKDDGVISFRTVEEFNKEPGYIPCGSAITSYARNFTIRTAQSNYHRDKEGFLYADTDSIHCNIPVEQIKNAVIHKSELCCWKHESSWDKAIFTRQKTYIEHVVSEAKPYHDIKCAGMGDTPKEIFAASLDGKIIHDKGLDILKFTLKSKYKEPLSYSDFKPGLEIPGQLHPRRIKGGIVLQEGTYKMR